MTKREKDLETDEESNDSDYGEDMLDMVEKDDLEFIKNAITSKSYNIFNKVRYSGATTSSGPKPKKRKLSQDEDLEIDYEDRVVDKKPMRTLLPIKTKHGIIRKEIVDDSEDKDEEVEEPEEDEQKSDEGIDEGDEEFTFIEDSGGIDLSKPISATQMVTARNDILKKRKIHIGTLSSGLLENPEEKITNLRTLLQLLDEETPEVFYTVRKLVTVSLMEIFKDILPSYEIKKTVSDGIKVKKDTLKLMRFEENLLQYYKKYLQKLEKNAMILMKRKGDSRKFNEEEIKLGELSLQAMNELLTTHSYFNFAQNLAQAVVPFLNNPQKNLRELVKNGIKTIFKEDKKEEITLKILRIINNYLKTHSHDVNPDMLEVLLVLNLKDINLDQEKEQNLKEKKLKAHKSRVLQLSKKERKRNKRLQELEKELLETKAEENKQTKLQNLTEITKLVFGIYFRILKSSTNTKVIGICLEGLAKYAHCINLEFYVDLVNVLDKLLKEDWIGYKEQLHCIQTVFAILSGQGEALNVDPTRFYTSLYKDLFATSCGRNYENFLIVLKTLTNALIKRRKKITNRRTIGFVKKIATLSLQLLHNGTLGSLSLIKSSLQLNKNIDILLDLDNSVGEGKFQPEVDDPEYVNASSTALYELVLLKKHYHPVVGKFARNIAYGVPASGEGSLPPEFGKCSAEQLYADYDMSQMAFNPAVPVPKKATPSSKKQRHIFADSSFEDFCNKTMKTHLKLNGKIIF